MSISDILIHINESLNEKQRHTLEEAIRDVEGVIAPRFSPGKEHLLLVAFNPDIATTASLLSKVQSSGYTAKLVGG